MAAAVELAERRVPVTVFEASRTLGGRARRVDVNGLALDNGLHILIGAYRETLQTARNGVRRAPYGTAAPAARPSCPRQVSAAHRAASRSAPLGRRRCCARRDWASLNDCAPHSGCRGSAPRTSGSIRTYRVAQLLARHRQGARALRHLWEPLCMSALNTPPESASAQVFLNVLRDSLNGRREDSELLLPDHRSLRTVPGACRALRRAARRPGAAGHARVLAAGRRPTTAGTHCGRLHALQPRDLRAPTLPRRRGSRRSACASRRHAGCRAPHAMSPSIRSTCSTRTRCACRRRCSGSPEGLRSGSSIAARCADSTVSSAW